MEDLIRNKVKESGLIAVDLAEFNPKETDILSFDIADYLWQGLILKEKDFRQFISDHDWTQYEQKSVYVHCSADAIVPTWAYMLVVTKLQPYVKKALVGSKLDLLKSLIVDQIQTFDLSDKIDGRFIVKGCADIPAPEFSMVELTKHLQTVAKSIMYGEPCSTVPIFKRK